MVLNRITFLKITCLSRKSVKAASVFIQMSILKKLEDRLLAQLRFPDDLSEQVMGRLCYSDAIDDDITVYVFSVIDGFYSLHAAKR